MITFPLHTLVACGRTFFAAAIGFFGLQQLMLGEFVTRALPPWPTWVPARPVWLYLTAVLFICGAAAVLLRWQPRRAALGIATLILLSAIMLPIPTAIAQLTSGGAWTNAGKALVLGSGSLLVATTFPIEAHSPTDRMFIAASRIVLGAFLTLCGVEHFIYANFVVSLIPGWIPGAPFWAYFAGVALVAGGLGLITCILVKWAALLSGLMILLWVPLLHVPRALTIADANEWTAVFEALAFSGVAFMLTAKLWTRTPRKNAEESLAAEKVRRT